MTHTKAHRLEILDFATSTILTWWKPSCNSLKLKDIPFQRRYRYSLQRVLGFKAFRFLSQRQKLLCNTVESFPPTRIRTCTSQQKAFKSQTTVSIEQKYILFLYQYIMAIKWSFWISNRESYLNKRKLIYDSLEDAKILCTIIINRMLC